MDILIDNTMNISQNNIYSDCHLKCSYSFQYSNSGCVASNTGSEIVLSYDESNVPPVTYNGNKYQVGKVRLTTSKLLLYNGKNTNASLIIEHMPVSGGGNFSVMIPIIAGAGYTASTTILTTIITDTANLAPQTGNKTTISLDNYNLNNIVPKKPYYSFNMDNTSIIVYGAEYAISVDADTLTKLSTITKGTNNMIPASTYPLFYNSKGPNSMGGDGTDNIYIDCQPVNMSEETIQVTTQNYKMKSENNLGDVMLKIYNNPWFQLLLLIFAVVVFYYIIQFLLKMGDVNVVK